MSTFYKAGQQSSWSGVCEVSEDGSWYYHHPKWPMRDMDKNILFSGDLNHLLLDGYWTQFIPPPEVDEGL